MWTVEIQSNGAAALEDRQSFPAMTSASSYPLTCIRRWFSLWLWWRQVLILLLWTVPFIPKSYTQRQVAMTFDTHCLLIWGLADCIRLSSDNTNTLWFAIFVRMIYIHWAMLTPAVMISDFHWKDQFKVSSQPTESSDCRHIPFIYIYRECWLLLLYLIEMTGLNHSGCCQHLL